MSGSSPPMRWTAVSPIVPFGGDSIAGLGVCDTFHIAMVVATFLLYLGGAI